MRIEMDTKAQKNLRKLRVSDQETSQKAHKVLGIMAKDPWDPQLDTTKFISYGHFPKARKTDRIWHTRISVTSKAWRVYWRQEVVDNEPVIDVLYIGPHLKGM